MDNQTLIPKQDLVSSESNSKWAKKRKLFYITIFVIILLTFGVFLYFKLFYTSPSCFDGNQNQEEVGIDCGGPCDTLCITQVSKITVDWIKVFNVSKGVYSVAASIENPNKTASAKNVSYEFQIYNKSGVVIENRSGNIFIKPRDKFIIFEPNIRPKNGNIPTSATISFEKSPTWKISKYKDVPIYIKNKRLINVGTQPKLTATLFNNSVSDIFDPSITAVVYDNKNKPIAVSSTFVNVVKKNSQKNIFFTWPKPFTNAPKIGCTSPVDAMLVFDRSGSMGFAGSNPSQPLTDAKNAALEFIKDMQVQDQIGLVSFATTASFPIDQKLTKSHDNVKKAINSISILSPARQQHTNLGDGIENATAELLSDKNTQNVKKAIVILTDGVASRPFNPKDKNDIKYSSNYAQEKARIASDNNISVYAIGLGDNIDEKFLKNGIVSSPNNYFKASNSSELKDVYNKIAKTICKEESFITSIVVHVKDTNSNI